MTPPTATNAAEQWVGRRGAVHLVEPGRDALHAVVDRSLADNFAELITTAVDNCAAATRIEILLIPMANDYAICLHAPDTESKETTPRPVEPAQGSTSTLQRAAEQYLPDLWGIETGDLWLGPWLSAQTATYRAITKTQEGTVSKEWSPLSRLDWWTQQNDTSPLAYQMLIEPAGDKYHLTLRAMDPDPQAPRSRSQLTQTLTGESTSPMDATGIDAVSGARTLAAQIWATTTVSDPDDDTPTTYPTLGSPRDTAGDVPTIARQALQLVSGEVESRGLLTATTGSDYYSKVVWDPQLSLSKSELQNMFYIPGLIGGLPEEYYTWKRPPHFDGDTIVREPTATDSTDVLPAPESESWRSPIYNESALDVIHSWVDLPPAVDSQSLPTRTQRPHLDPDSDVLPDGVAVVDRTATPTDIPIGSPGGIVSLANDAVTNETQLWILAVDADSAAWASEVLRQPVSTLYSSSVAPYALPQHWVVDEGDDDGDWLPLIDPERQWGWRILPNGRWLIRALDEIRGYGSIESITDPEELTLPYLRRTDSGVEYTTPDGEIRAQYDSIDDLNGDIEPAKAACLPEWPTFAGRLQVRYVDAVGLHSYRPPARWRTAYTSGSDPTYFAAAAREFVETCTIERPDNAPPAINVWPWFKRYYFSRADFDVRKASRRRFKRGVETPVHIDDEAVMLPERTWVIPPPQQR